MNKKTEEYPTVKTKRGKKRNQRSLLGSAFHARLAHLPVTTQDEVIEYLFDVTARRAKTVFSDEQLDKIAELEMEVRELAKFGALYRADDDLGEAVSAIENCTGWERYGSLPVVAMVIRYNNESRRDASHRALDVLEELQRKLAIRSRILREGNG